MIRKDSYPKLRRNLTLSKLSTKSLNYSDSFKFKKSDDIMKKYHRSINQSDYQRRNILVNSNISKLK